MSNINTLFYAISIIIGGPIIGLLVGWGMDKTIDKYLSKSNQWVVGILILIVLSVLYGTITHSIFMLGGCQGVIAKIVAEAQQALTDAEKK